MNQQEIQQLKQDFENLKYEFESLKSNNDAWVKQINTEMSDIKNVIIEVFEVLNYLDNEIGYNYEKLFEVRHRFKNLITFLRKKENETKQHTNKV